MPQRKIALAIFASGTGSNARLILEKFRDHPVISVALIVASRPDAGVLHHAREFGVETLVLDKNKFREDGYVAELEKKGIGFIVLAGFLWMIPPVLVRAFPRRIINIHPALLPNYGGRGMYGSRVHEAVIAAGETRSGITIHYVDEIYDHGEHIFQQECMVSEGDDASSLARKVQELEHRHFPTVIEEVVKKQFPGLF